MFFNWQKHFLSKASTFFYVTVLSLCLSTQSLLAIHSCGPLLAWADEREIVRQAFESPLTEKEKTKLDGLFGAIGDNSFTHYAIDFSERFGKASPLLVERMRYYYDHLGIEAHAHQHAQHEVLLKSLFVAVFPDGAIFSRWSDDFRSAQIQVGRDFAMIHSFSARITKYFREKIRLQLWSDRVEMGYVSARRKKPLTPPHDHSDSAEKNGVVLLANMEHAEGATGVEILGKNDESLYVGKPNELVFFSPYQKHVSSTSGVERTVGLHYFTPKKRDLSDNVRTRKPANHH